MRACLYITFTIICVAIAIIDIQKQTIYNEAVAVLLVPAIVSFFVCTEVSVVSRLLGMVSVSGIMLGVCLLIPGAFGGGDIKLMVPVGLFLGVERTMAAWVLAVLIGGFWGVCTIIWCMWKERSGHGHREQGRGALGGEANRIGKNMEFPFGPALCMGSVAVLWSGDSIIKFMP